MSAGTAASVAHAKYARHSPRRILDIGDVKTCHVVVILRLLLLSKHLHALLPSLLLEDPVQLESFFNLTALKDSLAFGIIASVLLDRLGYF